MDETRNLSFSADLFVAQCLRMVEPNDIVERVSPCSRCNNKHSVLRLTTVRIPRFKKVVVRSYVCDKCGYKCSEVKGDGRLTPKARSHILIVKRREDLSRDVLKSDTASVEIPSVDLEVTAGSLGGVLTTVQGLIMKIVDKLEGSSSDGHVLSRKSSAISQFLDRLRKLAAFESGPFTLIINDPLSGSYIQDLCHPEPDPQLEITDYERTPEQEDDLGMDGMCVEGYETAAVTTASEWAAGKSGEDEEEPEEMEVDCGEGVGDRDAADGGAGAGAGPSAGADAGAGAGTALGRQANVLFSFAVLMTAGVLRLKG